MEDLLTKKELAAHWKVSERTVDQYREDGIVQTCNLPIVRFNPQHIRELDNTKLDKFSPIERHRLERELEKWKSKAEKLEGIIAKMNILITEAVYAKQKEGGQVI
ncbi:histidine kinase [Clostridium tyrobutyricum]|uniref:histidine kinase n=1 Tax=Clostridium tyrobutyricum TaxID=1519 RepID=UPI00189E9F66|nr:histidine kinase [Clostridium tyrobutyricum]